MKTLSRRTFLRGAVGGTSLALGLPLLDAMIRPRQARGAGDGLGPVFGVFFWGGGTPWHAGHVAEFTTPDTWTPTGTGAGYTPSELIGELATHQPSVVTGLTPTTAIPDSPAGQSDGHMRGFMVNLEHLSGIQRRLGLAPAVCQPLPRPDGGDLTSGDLIARTELMAQLLATAVQCNLTRVFSFMLTSPATTHRFTQFGEERDFHTVVHNGPWEIVRQVHHHQMQALNKFLDVFQATTDASGDTLLDRSCILGLSEYGEGNRHSVSELPVLLLGGACGRLKRNIHVRDPGATVSRVHLTALRALGLDVPSFGWNGGETDSPVTELLA